MRVRELLKRNAPRTLTASLVRMRERLTPPPLEAIKLHGYKLIADPSPKPRLSLIMPSIRPERAFGGVTTGLELFIAIGKRCNADLRIVLDDFERIDRSVVDKCAAACGLDPSVIAILAREADEPTIEVRKTDIFLSFNWWTTLNIRPLIVAQAKLMNMEPLPYLYLVQEYDPFLYPFSSTHMMARLAFDFRSPCWGLFNSHELFNYFIDQGHAVSRSYVFEAQLSKALRPMLSLGPVKKQRRILIYGRPTIPRNCFTAVQRGLEHWASAYPEHSNWEVVSAGLSHPPFRIGEKAFVGSLGKLPLDRYGDVLRTTAVGLSLMASPHTSYPPLEMAHFGLKTLTNTYPCKDPSLIHENLVSLADIAPDTIASALATVCADFERDPDSGWSARSLRPSFLDFEPLKVVEDISADLMSFVWGAETRQP